MRARVVIAIISVTLTGLLIALALVGGWPYARLAQAAPPARPARVTVNDMQALFFVWASGTPAVQREAAADCARLALTPRQCARVSAAVRAAWLELAASDPSAVGRPGHSANLPARDRTLAALATALGGATHSHLAALLTITRATQARIAQPGWVAANIAHAQALPEGTALVWATSFEQTSLPGGLNPKTSLYAALPDAYLKFADWGQSANIPSLYQAIYMPTGATTHWAVAVSVAQGSPSASNVLITDVGPWNEDDNWWDPNSTSRTLAPICPIAAQPAFSTATSNALVDGICPAKTTNSNLRRIYYYLLYQHNGLPFFQTRGYTPSGSYSGGFNAEFSGDAWPPALAQYCSEAAAASTNADGITCYTGPAYNVNQTGWARDGTHQVILNQSSIDLSPGVNTALGWTYPSSGLVQVTVNALP